MGRRLMLDAEFRTILEDQYGYKADHLYFQPTDSTVMKYPAIVYKRLTFKVVHADNRSFNVQDQYDVIAITRNPDDELPRKIQEHFRMCRPGRQFMADNLYHFPFTITF